MIPTSDAPLILSLALIWAATLPIDRYWSFSASLRYDTTKARAHVTFPSFLKSRRARLNTIKIFYDPECGFCKATAHIFRELCIGPFGHVAPSDTDKNAHKLLTTHDSWVLYADNGKTYLEWEGVAYMLRQTPLLWIFGVLTDLPPIKPLMKRAYHLIGNNRRTLSRVMAPILKPQEEKAPTTFHICAVITITVLLLCMIFDIPLFSLLPGGESF